MESEKWSGKKETVEQAGSECQDVEKLQAVLLSWLSR